MKKILIPFAAAATLAAAVSSAQARDVRFSYEQHQLSSAAGATSLYNRIESRARTSCVRIGRKAMYEVQQEEACIAQVIASLVAQINDPQLNQIHASRVSAARYAAR